MIGIDNDKDPDIVIEDVEDMGGGFNKNTSFKDIVIKHYQKCLDAAAQEMHAGGEKTILINNIVQTVSKENTIQIFCNAVRGLRLTLTPTLYSNIKFMRVHLDELNQMKQEIKEFVRKKKEEIDQIPQMNNFTKKRLNKIAELRIDKQNMEFEYYMLEFGKMAILLGKENWFEEKYYAMG